MKDFWPKNVSYFQILQGKHLENFKDEVFWIPHGLYKGPCSVREGFQNTSRLSNFHQHMDHAAYALQAAWVRLQQQLPCSWFCVNELQSAAKIMHRRPKKLKRGLPSTCLTCSLYHSETSCVISTESDQHFVTRFSLSSSNWVAAYNLGRIHRTPRGSLRVGSSSGDNAHRFQKEKWSVLSCQNKKWFLGENTSRILHEVFKF